MKNKNPLRKVIETKYDLEKNQQVDLLECGHRWVWSPGDPFTGRGGTSQAKHRHCFYCAIKNPKD